MAASPGYAYIEGSRDLASHLLSLYMYERIDFFCSTLTLLPPLEQRFLATYLEGLCRLHAQTLAFPASVINAGVCVWQDGLVASAGYEQEMRLRLMMCLCLLENEKRAAADELYQVLVGVEEVVERNQMKPVDGMSAEIMTLLVMACSHGSFTFKQKEKLHQLILRITPLRDSLKNLREGLHRKCVKLKALKRRYAHKSTSTEQVTKCHAGVQCNLTAQDSVGKSHRRRASQFSVVLPTASQYEDVCVNDSNVTDSSELDESWCKKWVREQLTHNPLLPSNEDGFSVPTSLIFYNSSHLPQTPHPACTTSTLDVSGIDNDDSVDGGDDGGGSRMSDGGSRMSDGGSRMSDGGSRMSDRGSRMSDRGSLVSDGGSLVSADALAATLVPWRLWEIEEDRASSVSQHSSVTGEYLSLAGSESSEVPLVYQHYSPLHLSAMPITDLSFLDTPNICTWNTLAWLHKCCNTTASSTLSQPVISCNQLGLQPFPVAPNQFPTPEEPDTPVPQHCAHGGVFCEDDDDGVCEDVSDVGVDAGVASCCNCGAVGHGVRECPEESYTDLLANTGQSFRMKFLPNLHKT